MTDLSAYRLLLDCDTLPQDWHFSYGIRGRRMSAFLKPRHRDSFFKSNSETALTVFMLGRLEGWKQARLVNCAEIGSTPRVKKSGKWNSAFFRRLTSNWAVGASSRRSALSDFLEKCFALPADATVDLFLLFEVGTFNNAFNCGKTVRNPSFLRVADEWSQFDALVILPAARLLIIVESKLDSDSTHGAGGYNVTQPIRNLETAFFLTTLPDSKYCGWDFRYLLLCPKSADGRRKDCEQFFLGGYGEELDAYDRRRIADPLLSLRVCADRIIHQEAWQNKFRANLKGRLAIAYWSELMAALSTTGFDRCEYLERLSSIDRSIVEATEGRWAKAGIIR